MMARVFLPYSVLTSSADSSVRDDDGAKHDDPNTDANTRTPTREPRDGGAVRQRRGRRSLQHVYRLQPPRPVGVKSILLTNL